MTDRSTRFLKAVLCFLACVAYGYIYRGYLRLPLIIAIATLPAFVQRLLILLSMTPVFLVAIYWAVCVLKTPAKNQPLDGSTRRGAETFEDEIKLLKSDSYSSIAVRDFSMHQESTFKPRILPRTALDVLTVLVVAPLQMALLFGIPSLVAWLVYPSGLFVACVMIGFYCFIIAFSVRSLTLGSEGFHFQRLLGPPKRLPLEAVISVERASRWDLICYGWLWPIFPAREMSPSLSSQDHYRIVWKDGFCYFPPNDPVTFEACVAGHLESRPIALNHRA